MQILIALLVVAAVVVFTYLVIQKQDQRRHTGGAICAEYRTDLPFDVCMDAMRRQTNDDIFVYDFTRQPDGSFLLNFTMHRATGQPMDTLYQMRIDGGSRTVISLNFIREAFGNPEPVFGVELLDAFICQKLSAERTM